ncbi:MAG: DNA replication/repair protein RecF [Pseudomonadota bacterium]
MRISSLHLRNFRNLTDLHIRPGHTFNLFVGANAQGKTNIIESVGLISTSLSFRTQDFRDMIQQGQQKALVCAEVQSEIGKDELAVTMNLKQKTFLKNGKRTRNTRIYTVLFAPEEIMLIRSSPAARRKHMDTLISQLLPTYRNMVSRYEKVIRHRNRILCDFDVPSRLRSKNLKPWDDQLIALGAKVVAGRNMWCERLNCLIPEHYTAIAPKDPPAMFTYMPHCGEKALGGGIDSIEEALASQLDMRREDELLRGFTVVGPHRDDFEAKIGAGGIKHFGSQGQHRSFILALKMSEMDLFKEVSGEEPILLLDDVASELDSHRNCFFFECLRQAKGQVFITATAERDFNWTNSHDVFVFDVVDGTVTARK